MISIIIPHYNRSELIKETINSVISQGSQDWELIIVDDGSELTEFNSLRAYIEKDKRIQLLRRRSGKKGPSACRNEGVEIARGEYIIFLDSDDLLKNFCLQQRYKSIGDEPDIAIFLIENFKSVPGDLGSYFNINLPYEELAGAFIQNNNPWQTMAPIWKKSFFKQVGGFDEDFLFMEDPDIHFRALIVDGVKVKFCYDEPADCYYRIHHNDKTKADFNYNSIYFRILFYKKIIEKNTEPEFLRKNSGNIRIGLFNLIKSFIYYRRNELEQVYHDLISLMRKSKLFSSFEITKVSLLINLGNSDAYLVRKLRFKGICYRLLPAK